MSVFQNRLHLSANQIVFARRGRSDRTGALRAAIELCQSRFEQRWRKGINRDTSLESALPHQHAGLQAIDYVLWAFQRLLERREPRFFNAIRAKFALIIDVDDTRRYGYGEYYTSRNPLTMEKLMPVTEARSE